MNQTVFVTLFLCVKKTKVFWWNYFILKMHNAHYSISFTWTRKDKFHPMVCYFFYSCFLSWSKFSNLFSLFFRDNDKSKKLICKSGGKGLIILPFLLSSNFRMKTSCIISFQLKIDYGVWIKHCIESTLLLLSSIMCAFFLIFYNNYNTQTSKWKSK